MTFRYCGSSASGNLFSHQSDVPIFGHVVTKKVFAISSQIPLRYNFPLTERKFVELSCLNKYLFITTKLTMANLLASLLRLTVAPCAYRSPLFTFTHIIRNAMRGRKLSLPLSVKHYETRIVKFIPIKNNEQLALHPIFNIQTRYPFKMLNVASYKDCILFKSDGALQL